jgi:hypothetical protein
MNEQGTAVVQHQQQQGQQSLMEMTPQSVVAQVQLIQQVMKVCMKEGEHYGKIPGCGDKPTLLKAGAEKLNLTFRMAADYDVTQTEHGEGHREYQVKCRLNHINSGLFLGAGVGSASTLETKWRYRWENTGKEVPKEYWESRDNMLLGGPDFVSRKTRDNRGGQSWIIFHRVPHDNPADYFNTCLKMAKKRAHVDAVLTATAASDIFTQDIEELKENGVIDTEVVDPPTRAPVSQPSGNSTAAAPKPAATVNKPAGSVILSSYGTKPTARGGTKYSCKGDDGKYYSTFDDGIGDSMKDMQGIPVIVEGVWNEKYKNFEVKDLHAADDGSQQQEQEPDNGAPVEGNLL